MSKDNGAAATKCTGKLTFWSSKKERRADEEWMSKDNGAAAAK